MQFLATQFGCVLVLLVFCGKPHSVDSLDSGLEIRRTEVLHHPALSEAVQPVTAGFAATSPRSAAELLVLALVMLLGWISWQRKW